jgi:CelD/BcsL family acetyltransferase involved in cellulose biosynthesis
MPADRRVGVAAPSASTVEPLADLEAARDVWNRLARGSDNIFSTWEWAEVWWRHFGAGRSLALSCVRDEHGRPLAVLPLYQEARRGVRLTRLVGHGVADQLGPVCAPSDLAPAREALGRAGGDVVLAERLSGEIDWAPLEGRVMRAEASPVIANPGEGGWEAYLRARSANFRQQVRRRGRRLSVALGIRFRIAQERARLAADMDALIGLHAARWGSASSAFSGRRAAFHREFAAAALERGWLRLWLAEAEGGAVAAWYGFRFGGVEYFYQSGRDPAWAAECVGGGLLEHSIREAFADGVREYRLLRGDERYKQRYATETRQLVTIVVPHTGRGRAVVAAARLLAAAPQGRMLLQRAAG